MQKTAKRQDKKRDISLSVIILNYNTKDDLYTCLRTLTKTLPPFKIEFIVVDNASTDGSTDKLDNKFPSLKVIRNKQNLYFNGGFNTGLAVAQGKYVLMMEPDTEVSAKTLIQMKSFMEKNKKCAIACPRQTDSFGRTLETAHSFPTPLVLLLDLPIVNKLFKDSILLKEHTYEGLDRRKTYEIDAAPGAFMFCRRDILEQIGFFDEKFWLYYSDDDLSRRTKEKGWQIYHVGSIPIVHAVSQSTNRVPFVYILFLACLDKTYYAYKYYGFWWASLIYIASSLHLFLYTLIQGFKYVQKTLARVITIIKSYGV